MVSRLYAGLLRELGVLPAASVEETSGIALASGGLTELQKLLEKIKDGGLLFIDEVRSILDACQNWVILVKTITNSNQDIVSWLIIRYFSVMKSVSQISE